MEIKNKLPSLIDGSIIDLETCKSLLGKYFEDHYETLYESKEYIKYMDWINSPNKNLRIALVSSINIFYNKLKLVVDNEDHIQFRKSYIQPIVEKGLSDTLELVRIETINSLLQMISSHEGKSVDKLYDSYYQVIQDVENMNSDKIPLYILSIFHSIIEINNIYLYSKNSDILKKYLRDIVKSNEAFNRKIGYEFVIWFYDLLDNDIKNETVISVLINATLKNENLHFIIEKFHQYSKQVSELLDDISFRNLIGFYINDNPLGHYDIFSKLVEICHVQVQDNMEFIVQTAINQFNESTQLNTNNLRLFNWLLQYPDLKQTYEEDIIISLQSIGSRPPGTTLTDFHLTYGILVETIRFLQKSNRIAKPRYYVLMKYLVDLHIKTMNEHSSFNNEKRSLDVYHRYENLGDFLISYSSDLMINDIEYIAKRFKSSILSSQLNIPSGKFIKVLFELLYKNKKYESRVLESLFNETLKHDYFSGSQDLILFNKIAIVCELEPEILEYFQQNKTSLIVNYINSFVALSIRHSQFSEFPPNIFSKVLSKALVYVQNPLEILLELTKKTFSLNSQMNGNSNLPMEFVKCSIMVSANLSQKTDYAVFDLLFSKFIHSSKTKNHNTIVYDLMETCTCFDTLSKYIDKLIPMDTENKLIPRLFDLYGEKVFSKSNIFSDRYEIAGNVLNKRLPKCPSHMTIPNYLYKNIIEIILKKKDSQKVMWRLYLVSWEWFKMVKHIVNNCYCVPLGLDNFTKWPLNINEDYSILSTNPNSLRLKFNEQKIHFDVIVESTIQSPLKPLNFKKEFRSVYIPWNNYPGSSESKALNFRDIFPLKSIIDNIVSMKRMDVGYKEVLFKDMPMLRNVRLFQNNKVHPYNSYAIKCVGSLLSHRDDFSLSLCGSFPFEPSDEKLKDVYKELTPLFRTSVYSDVANMYSIKLEFDSNVYINVRKLVLGFNTKLQDAISATKLDVYLSTATALRKLVIETDDFQNIFNLMTFINQNSFIKSFSIVIHELKETIEDTQYQQFFNSLNSNHSIELLTLKTTKGFTPIYDISSMNFYKFKTIDNEFISFFR
ncbi:hypothetical protein DLAC_05073 [Tieghemostelium lacteum]|uniref:Uncharacterized protein n=1 Tax=Tieghemostelium lacteum TaxID=361077 RepID=A0A151ZI91_TIELA|nr:hypothetical protein DLAC_05073 [Tieghemostelium lacteum]|eukprot:KYQ93686.1 hypothetical protein DLAC_05073 [Tieghemostelium lacteum]